MDKDIINEKKKNVRIEYRTVIICSKIISDGKVNIFDPPIEINVTNIAPEGLCISSFESFKEGAMLEFDIILENTLYNGIAAKIIWRTNHENTYHYGLHIQNITGRLGIHILKIRRRVLRNV